MSDWFTTLQTGLDTMGPDVASALLVLVLAFCLGQVIGAIYMWTHVSLSYSRMFAASLVVIPIIVSLVMVLMSGNIAIAFGLLAVFAVVRFRNVLKDTRDTTFILWAIIQGMAVGTMQFTLAVVGCVCVSLVFLYLRFVAYGTRHRYDVVLSVHWSGGGDGIRMLRPILRRHSVRAQLAGRRDGPDQGLDLSYRLLLRDPARGGELVAELQQAEGVDEVSMFHREDESEI
jgi:hypothetical protein